MTKYYVDAQGNYLGGFAIIHVVLTVAHDLDALGQRAKSPDSQRRIIRSP